ncbi:hypothetical protein OJ253_2147 [Cryptosporidium canis]|uniref:Uncharacterized protein n=1 Tax=Cryptosporidium canis TaxID=195482 RepID=A0A9D5DGT9_9CRYT|nr:hypothetical protein OJ253_2147 [Cryptosporidium canis]
MVVSTESRRFEQIGRIVHEGGSEEQCGDGDDVPESDGFDWEGLEFNVVVEEGEGDGDDCQNISEKVDRLPKVLADSVGCSSGVCPDKEGIDLCLQDLVVGGFRAIVHVAQVNIGVVDFKLFIVLELDLRGVVIQLQEVAEPDLWALVIHRVFWRDRVGGLEQTLCIWVIE